MPTYYDKREQRERPIPSCEKVSLVWDPVECRCVKPSLFHIAGLGMLGDAEYWDDYPPWPADGEYQCYCDNECFAYGDCCSGCGGSQGGGGGGGADDYSAWSQPGYDPFDPYWWLPESGNVFQIGSDPPDPGYDFWGNDPGAGFWDWFFGGFVGDPPLPDYVPDDWIPGSVPPLAGPTAIGVCPPGTYHPLPSEGDVTSCVPFPPGATEERKRQLTQQGNQAAASRNAAAQKAQQALQKAAQECAARGGRLVQTQQGYGCQLPNGQVQSLEASGIPGWLIAVLVGLGIVVILK